MPKIYQIFYSMQTKQMLDPGFMPLDNSANLRPDWREYWPIRNFILDQGFKSDEYYGFFSPSFYEKTKLTSEDVINFSKEVGNDFDVISFSPYADQAAFFLNTFAHADCCHPGFLKLIAPMLPYFGIHLDSRGVLVQHTKNTIFCNYFIAKPKFWNRWFEICEKIYFLAEEGNDFFAALNGDTNYKISDVAPLKTFLIERMASLIISLDSTLNVKAYNPFRLPFCWSEINEYHRDKLILLDALKIAYCETGLSQYIDCYIKERKLFVETGCLVGVS